MNKKVEREQFWINVGPESGYLGTIAEETARKNDGGISPDGKRLGWQNAADATKDGAKDDTQQRDPDDIATDFPYGDPCDSQDVIIGDLPFHQSMPTIGDCVMEDPTCHGIPLADVFPAHWEDAIPPEDIGPERQNTEL